MRNVSKPPNKLALVGNTSNESWGKAFWVKLLLDEHFSARVAVALRDRHHDVVAVQEHVSDGRRWRASLIKPSALANASGLLGGWRGLSDGELFDVAQQEGRTVVTENVAHFRVCADRFYEQGRSHHGLVYTTNEALPRHRHDAFVRELVTRLDRLLRANPRSTASSIETFI